MKLNQVITLKEFTDFKKQFEADGRQATGVWLTPDQAVELRRELYNLYGEDPGDKLMTLYGLEVLSTEAKELRFDC